MLNQCLEPVYSNVNGSRVRAGVCLDDLKTTFIIDMVQPSWKTDNVPAEFRLRHKRGGKFLYVYDAVQTANMWTCWSTPSQVKIFEFRKYL